MVWSLIRDTGATLLDYVPEDEDLPEEKSARSSPAEGAEIVDLHVWQLGPATMAHRLDPDGRAKAPHSIAKSLQRSTICRM